MSWNRRYAHDDKHPWPQNDQEAVSHVALTDHHDNHLREIYQGLENDITFEQFKHEFTTFWNQRDYHEWLHKGSGMPSSHEHDDDIDTHVPDTVPQEIQQPVMASSQNWTTRYANIDDARRRLEEAKRNHDPNSAKSHRNMADAHADVARSLRRKEDKNFHWGQVKFHNEEASRLEKEANRPPSKPISYTKMMEHPHYLGDGWTP